MDMEKLLLQQREFFDTDQTKNIDFRISQLKKIKAILKENEDLLYEAIYKDFKKSEFETYTTELSLLYHEIDNFIKNTKKWSKRKKVAAGMVNFPAKSYILAEPLGVTLVIGAWNYPYQLSLLPAITSIAAGNTVILKPSELPVNTSKVMAKLINDNFPENYFHVVEGGVQETKLLLEHRYDKIFFTGSIPVGKIIYQAAAKHLTPVTLELGGKSPTFVLADADLKMTAKRIVWSKFLNAGQTCISPDYVLVDKSIEQAFLDALKMEIEASFENKHKIDENYLQIINTKNFDRLSKLVESGQVYFGGNLDREERFISPTILHNVTFSDEVMKDEIFGPILPVISFDKLEKAISEVKSRPKPLSCYIYSKNRKIIRNLLKTLSFGGGAINDSVMHLTNSKLPFGGVGFSGIGSYHGKAGFDSFTHYKSILDKPFWFEPNIKYAPYSKCKKAIIQWMME
ncbi:aldehyde dehydrogenase [uncultured Cyclobacterium sp.]|uniref:aldehyde dehydrogenase n=1 Tax=uncultured Cyclobacterium sp. TaxID=453820 RepID=UPI0030ED8890|tara:strand:- start:716 stop:2086 length:1371 start_codon:yes stop_codon:yes gene_type:complete